MFKIATGNFKNFLLKEVSDSLATTHKVKTLLNRAIEIVNASEEKEHIYQVAGDIIINLPKKLDRLENTLTKILYFLNIYMRKDLRTFLSVEDKSEIDEIFTSEKNK